MRHQQPVIVFIGLPSSLGAAYLDIHSVVVTAFDHQHVTFIDPLDGLAHTQERSEFFPRWENAFHAAILLHRP